MEVINLHHPYEEKQIPTGDVVLALGFFDGLHKGHQAVIAAGKKEAKKRNLPLALMTFNQHPSIVFHKQNPEISQYLTNLPEKKRLLETLGVDILYVVEFTSDFAALSPQDFVDQYIVGLHGKVVVCGFDYTYGPKDIADVAHLPHYGKGRFLLKAIEKYEEDGEKVSSTRIREDLRSGKIEEANELLGRPYSFSGVVVHGEARGRTLGYPTANLQVAEDVFIPTIGVYATKILVKKKWYIAMTSVGHNNTFGEGRDLSVEVNILHFNGDIYGEKVVLEWYHLLRPQVKFKNAEELITQLGQDKMDTENYFK